MAKKNVLGRGLGALISDASTGVEVQQEMVSVMRELSMDDIIPNPLQPRRDFNEDELLELAASIKNIGLVQPITVRGVDNGKYEIIAGERRYRACRLLDNTTIPVYVKDTTDENVLELALIENIQRSDLNAIEIAISYQRLLEECKITQDELSERVGKKRATITNYLRLLKLPSEIQLAVRDNVISMGHARAILGVSDVETQLMVFEQIQKFDFSVRKVEEIVREITNPSTEEEELEVVKPKKKKDIGEYLELQKHLTKRFDTKVTLKRNDKGKGKIEINFASDGELEKILDLLDKI